MSAILMQISPSALLSLTAGLAGGIGIVAVFWLVYSRVKARTFQQNLKHQIEDAKKESENIIKAAQLEAATESIKRKEQFAAETNQIRNELRETEIRLSKREDTLDKQVELVRQREKAIAEQTREIDRRAHNISVKEKQLSNLLAQQKNQLLKITAMSVEDAKDLLLKRLEDECELEMSALIQRKVEETTETVAEKSREIISTAIQRYVAEQTCEVTVSTVEIPNDDMKGRIIGREGRNIRAFEKATGVDVIVDDTPGMIVVSGFDAVRREVARLAMERLIQDGRIHPSRIEEIVAQVKKEINQKLLQLGKDAAVEANIRGLSNRVLSLIGALNYRTSYGQNVLRHSIEVAYLSQASGSAARYRQVDRPRDGRQPSCNRGEFSEAFQRIEHNTKCRGGPSRGHSARQSIYAVSGRGRRNKRFEARRQERDVREVYQAAGKARGDSKRLQGRRERLRHSGRARNPCYRQCREG